MTSQSNIVLDSKLISYDKWFSYIDSLKEQVKKNITDEKQAIDNIKDVFVDSIKKRLPNEKFGILFSGGVDSTLIAHVCKQFTSNFVCYTVGTENSQDVEISSKIAKELKLKHKLNIFDIEQLERLFKRMSTLLGPELTNIVNLGVGSVELAAIELAERDNIKFFFTGLGSEEIFAGYKRHEDAKDINEECWLGLKSMHTRDFKRDYTISKSKKAKFLTPFLDKELIVKSMEIDASLKICKDYKKYIFRKVAESLGLPTEFAFRPKKAAQYGSNFDKAIKKIARSKGFKYKKEYLDFLSNNK